jgi:hypothetical protein
MARVAALLGCFARGLADLVIGEDPYMVGKIWEKMFAATYGREPATRGWEQGINAIKLRRFGSSRSWGEECGI